MTAFLFDRQALIFVIQKGNDYMNATVKKLFAAVLITTTCLFAAGCGSSSNSGASGDKKEIKMGVTAGPHAEVMEEVAKEAAKQGITIKVVEFNDYVQPNKALAEGDLDMNSMQHQPYMDNVVKKQGLKITSIGKTIILPMAVYSHKYKDIKDVADGAKVTIPNDPTNGARALLLIQQAGLIKLKNGNSVDASVTDITENPKNLQFVELDAAQIPRSIDDVDIALINTNFAMEAGLNPLKDALFLEPKDSPYANVLVIREGDENRPEIQKLVKALQSPEVKKFIEDKYQGAILPSF